MTPKQEKRVSAAFKQIPLAERGGVWAKIFVLKNLASEITPLAVYGPLFDSFRSGNTLLGERFFSPLEKVLPKLTRGRSCYDLPDADWLALGVLRVLHENKSGRGFLQEMASTLPNCPDVVQFFATLRSGRRLAVCQEADALLATHLRTTLPDALVEVEELQDFEVYAGDGHWHSAAAHDPRPAPDKPKAACGHFYALDLRHGQLRHLDLADQIERVQEHDMRVLKRQAVATLRQGAPKGRKVLYVWDRGGICFDAWEQWKRSGIYFLSREKENMVLRIERLLEWDREDPRNAGVLTDEISRSATGASVRRIAFFDAVSAQLYVFITNQMTLPPGVLAELARRRWQIEKVFDELKNKLAETGAWASSAEAKKMQAIFICITQQLLRALDHWLASEHQVRPERELERRQKRIQQERDAVAKRGHTYPSLRAAATSLTQHTVKLLRWLRSHLRLSAPWHNLIDALRRSYAAA